MHATQYQVGRARSQDGDALYISLQHSFLSLIITKHFTAERAKPYHPTISRHSRLIATACDGSAMEHIAPSYDWLSFAQACSSSCSAACAEVNQITFSLMICPTDRDDRPTREHP